MSIITINVGTVANDGTGDALRTAFQSVNTNFAAVLDRAGGTMTGALTLNADPTSALHAATKQYVDAVASGLDPKASVRGTTVSNDSLSGLAARDGVTPVAGDRWLVKNQTVAADNGIYIAAAGAWTRATDADADAEVTSGLFCVVIEGDVNANTGWVLTTADPITVGTTGLTFDQFSGVGGEANTGNNAGGGGVGPYDGMSGTVLQFRNLVGATGISVSLDAGNKEIDIAMDINSLTALTAPDNASDTLAIYDNSAATIKKISLVNLFPKWSKSITVEDPTNAEDISIFFTEKAITITEMRAVLIGSATPSVTWTIRHATTRDAVGNQVVTGGTVTTSTTTGSDVTAFNDATIPANSFIWLETTAQSGTVTELHISLIGTVD